MVDVAIVVLTDRGPSDNKPEYFHSALYLHSAGAEALNFIEDAKKVMDDRRNDASYALARLTAIACLNTGGNAGVGIIEGPKPKDVANKFEDYTYGDAGVIVWHTDSNKVECFAGYLATNRKLSA